MLVEREADVTDLDFIYSCILYGARKGHYSFNAENPEMIKAMKNEVKSIVHSGLLFDRRRATASVFSLKDTRVGSLIMSEVAPDTMGYEIYALSVLKKHQCKGIGGRMLDHVVNNFPYDDVLARCLPVSATMKRLLLARGFVLHDRDGEYDAYVKAGVHLNAMEQPVILRY